jgi:hypothetical protein
MKKIPAWSGHFLSSVVPTFIYIHERVLKRVCNLTPVFTSRYWREQALPCIIRIDMLSSMTFACNINRIKEIGAMDIWYALLESAKVK